MQKRHFDFLIMAFPGLSCIFSVVCLLLGAAVVLRVEVVDGKEFGWREWWKDTIIYQIYPRSFQDSNGDGVGDLKGITSRLSYFVDINVGAIWISPVYKSPFADFGYDISDFKDIDPIFGTLADFDELVAEAHKLGLKVIMDFVPNHSSDQHPWFLESKKNRDDSNPYRDYYVWADPRKDCSAPTPSECLPTNWISVFGGSAWEWVEERKQFYFHAFLKEQPDLNYRNQRVQDEMKDVLRFWMSRGVDGVRVDAIAHMMEDLELRDEPVNPLYKPTGKETRPQWTSLRHIYTFQLPDLHDVIKSWRSEVLDMYSVEPRYRFMTTEAYDDPINLLPYYGTKENPEADFPFNFQLISLKSATLSGYNVYQLVNSWLSVTPRGRWPNWVIGNHDNFRVAHRLGQRFSRAANVLNLLLPGTPTTYYGEELGMTHIDVTFDETQDPSGKNNPCCWKEYSRDPERSPMQWTTDKNAGFSTANKTWLPVNSNYLTGVNVQDQLKEETSMLNLYKSLANIRHFRPAFHSNNLTYALITQNIFSFVRMPNTDESDNPSYLVAVNFGNETVIGDYSTPLKAKGFKIGGYGVGLVEISSNMDRNAETVVLESLELQSGEALVIKIDVFSEQKQRRHSEL